MQLTSLHSSWSQPTLPCAVSPSSAVRASESASRSVTETDSPSKAEALICMLYRRLLRQPGDRAAEGSEVQLRDSALRRREAQARRAPDALRGRAEEGAGDAHVVVVGRADVHHQVGGRAQPVPAAEGVASPRRQSAGTLDLYSMQIRASAFEGESVSVTDLLADSLALTGSATLDGLTAQGNVGCDQLLCNDVNCTDVFTTGVDASGAVSCAALTATGTVAGATLTSTGAVSGSSLSMTGAASVGLLSSATGITGSTLTINNTANAGNFTTVGDVSTGTLTASGAATAASFAATGALTGATLTVSGAASTGPLDCESLGCTFTATSGGVSTGSVVCGDVTSSGTVSAPQLFASNTLTVTNTSDSSDDLFLTKNWAGWSKLQVSNNSAAPDSGPELRLLGNQSARVFLEQNGGAHQCELIMINDEALVQTKSLSTQLSLSTNQRNPGCLVIASNTGNVVCNTSFTDLSDSRVKTEIAEADVAELKQLFDSVEAKQYKRPDMNGDLTSQEQSGRI